MLAVGFIDWLGVWCGIDDKPLVALGTNPTLPIRVANGLSRVRRIRQGPPADLAMIVAAQFRCGAAVERRSRRCCPARSLPVGAATLCDVRLEIIAVDRRVMNRDFVGSRHVDNA